MVFSTHSRLCLLCCATGLAQGQSFQEDLLGEAAGDLPEDAGDQDEEEEEEGQQQQQQQPQPQQSGRASKQQQQAQARQATKEKKAASKQTDLTFVAHDRAVLQQLPPFVCEQVPFFATARGAIDVQLLTLLKLFSTAGVGFATMVKALQELQHTQYYQRMLVYFSYAAAVKSIGTPQVTGKGCKQWRFGVLAGSQLGVPAATMHHLSTGSAHLK